MLELLILSTLVMIDLRRLSGVFQPSAAGLFSRSTLAGFPTTAVHPTHLRIGERVQESFFLCLTSDRRQHVVPGPNDQFHKEWRL